MTISGSPELDRDTLARGITAGVRELEQDFLRCNALALEHKRLDGGYVSVRFVLDELGGASHPTNGGSDFYPQGVECAVRVMSRLRGPKPPAPTNVVVRLLFRGG